MSSNSPRELFQGAYLSLENILKVVRQSTRKLVEESSGEKRICTSTHPFFCELFYIPTQQTRAINQKADQAWD